MSKLSKAKEKYVMMCLTSGLNRDIKQGDYIFDGEKIHCIAEDFIGLSQHRDMNVIDVTVKDDSNGIGDSFKVRYTNRMLSDFIWLPSSEQLFEMYEEHSGLNHFDAWNQFVEIVSQYIRYYESTHSHTEMVLKFYMEMVNNKVWDGEQWKESE